MKIFLMTTKSKGNYYCCEDCLAVPSVRFSDDIIVTEINTDTCAVCGSTITSEDN